MFAVLLIAGCWFYYAYFMSTSAALLHAEEFLFRRMTVSQLGEQGGFRHFFVTNRLLESGDEPVEERFGTHREETLNYGSFDTSIEPSLGLGMMINPTAWFQNEEIKLLEVRKLEKEAFFAELRRLVDNSPNRSLLIIVHGFREGFTSALRKTTFIASVLDINTPVLVFDWPGDQGSSLSGYRNARTVASASGADLARTIETIVREIGPDHMSLLANSMGGQVVVDAFTYLYEQPDLVDAGKMLDHVVLTAPDVDHAEFNSPICLSR